MSREDFPATEFADRHSRVRAAMDAANIELLIVIAPTNIQYLIGTRTKSYQEFQCLLFPRDEQRPKVVLTRLAEVPEYTDLSLADDVRGWGGRAPEDPVAVLDTLLRQHGYAGCRTGLEKPDYYLSVRDYTRMQALFESQPAIDATSLVENLKLVKSATEIEYIRRAAAITDSAMHTARDLLQEGTPECEVAGAVYGALLSQGGDSPASPLNLVSGERSCYAHGAPSERRLRRGDSVNIEFGGAYRRYTVTIGRQFSIGPPPARLREVYAVVREACDACIARMQPGTPAVEPHQAATAVIDAAGLDRYRIHTTGYGIAPGYPPAWGESMHMFGDSVHTLRAGMMLSVEPPVFIHQERLGVRLIDNVLITNDGPEILTSFERDLLEC